VAELVRSSRIWEVVQAVLAYIADDTDWLASQLETPLTGR
jgi:hypothetical protein